MNRKGVLFLDQDQKDLEPVIQLLKQDENLQTFTVSSEDEVYTLLKERSVHVLVCDYELSNFDTLVFLQSLKKRYPSILRILLVEQGNFQKLQQFYFEEEIYCFLPKPWKNEEFRDSIYESLRFQESNQQQGIQTPCQSLPQELRSRCLFLGNIHTQNNEKSYKIYDISTNKTAWLRYLPDLEKVEEPLEKFMEIQHPNFVEIYSIFKENEDLYIFQELVVGKKLSSHILNKGALADREIIAILLPLCDAVHYIHQHELVHGCIDTENIILGPQEIPKIGWPSQFFARIAGWWLSSWA